jgi:hypothetical protein
VHFSDLLVDWGSGRLTCSNHVDPRRMPAFARSQQQKDRVVGKGAEVLAVLDLRSVGLEQQADWFSGRHIQLLLACNTVVPSAIDPFFRPFAKLCGV